MMHIFACSFTSIVFVQFNQLAEKYDSSISMLEHTRKSEFFARKKYAAKCANEPKKHIQEFLRKICEEWKLHKKKGVKA